MPPRQQRIPRGLAAGAHTSNGATIVAPRTRESRSANRLRPTLKILVTGASGFTGSHVARQAIEAGYAVRALVRASSSLELLEDAPVELVEGDLRDPASPRRATCESLSRRLGVEPPLHRRRLDFFLKDRAFRTEKASRVLDWRPQVDLPEGIRETLGWYRAHGWM